MTVKISTAWFPSIQQAFTFYQKKGLNFQQVKQKLDGNKIHLGEPPKRKNEIKRHLKNGRWVILIQL